MMIHQCLDFSFSELLKHQKGFYDFHDDLPPRQIDASPSLPYAKQATSDAGDNVARKRAPGARQTHEQLDRLAKRVKKIISMEWNASEEKEAKKRAIEVLNSVASIRKKPFFPGCHRTDPLVTGTSGAP